jgi:hypothetical protein
MSDSESVSSASTCAAPTLAELLKEARNFHKKAEGLLKEAAKAAKGVKVAKKKPAGEKKARKVSEGQLKWRAFQKFVWAEMKEENPATPFKEAMKAAGPRWNKGEPEEDDSTRFEEWLEENPIPSPEEAMAEREEKLEAEKAEKERKKEEREDAKATKAKAAKAAKAAPKTPAKPTKPAATAAPKKAAKAAVTSDSESEEEKPKKPTKAAPKAPKKAAAVASDSESEEEAPKKPAAKKLPSASKPVATALAAAAPKSKKAAKKVEPEAPADEDSLPTVEIAGVEYMRIGSNAYDKDSLAYAGRISADGSSIDFDAAEEK